MSLFNYQDDARSNIHNFNFINKSYQLNMLRTIISPEIFWADWNC